MEISGKKLVPFLGVLMATLVAVLLVVASEGAVTVYNPARIPAMDVLVGGDSLHVESGIMSIDVTDAEQLFNITTAAGDVISILVKDGNFIILLPEAFVGDAPAASVRVVPVPVPGANFDFSLPAGEPLAQP